MPLTASPKKKRCPNWASKLPRHSAYRQAEGSDEALQTRKARMLLSPQDVALFFKLQRALMFFVN
jgi:hypothetical protein